jgi:hypothetical protein
MLNEKYMQSNSSQMKSTWKRTLNSQAKTKENDLTNEQTRDCWLYVKVKLESISETVMLKEFETNLIWGYLWWRMLKRFRELSMKLENCEGEYIFWDRHIWPPFTRTKVGFSKIMLGSLCWNIDWKIELNAE